MGNSAVGCSLVLQVQLPIGSTRGAYVVVKSQQENTKDLSPAGLHKEQLYLSEDLYYSMLIQSNPIVQWLVRQYLSFREKDTTESSTGANLHYCSFYCNHLEILLSYVINKYCGCFVPFCIFTHFIKRLKKNSE